MVLSTVLGLQEEKKKILKKDILLLGFPSPPLAVSNGKSITQRLSVFVGHASGIGYPNLCGIPDKLLSPWRVSSSNQLDSLWPGTMYTSSAWLIWAIECQLLFGVFFFVMQPQQKLLVLPFTNTTSERQFTQVQNNTLNCHQAIHLTLKGQKPPLVSWDKHLHYRHTTTPLTVIR